MNNNQPQTTKIENKTLLTSCSDEKGLIAKITQICAKNQLNITNNKEFVDNNSKMFFMRTKLEGQFNDALLLQDLAEVLPNQHEIKLVPKIKKKIVVLVTKEAHCLGDILMKYFYGGLDVEIQAVIGNHPDLQTLVEKFDIPFHHISHQGISRVEHDKLLGDQIDFYQPDYIVLAKYMRVLNPEFVERFKNRVINIHHSFLPAFIGAKPYHQAFERGVKIIGASAHFINNELDEGPIIVQNVIPIDHSYDAQALMRAGRDVEKLVLTKALELVFADKVFIANNRTIIL